MFASRLKRAWKQGVSLSDGRVVDRGELLVRVAEYGRLRMQDYDDFRSDAQEVAMLEVLQGKHVFAVMPTGSGKSLIYQFPAHLDADRLTLVISPLRALIDEHGAVDGAVGLTSETIDREDIWRQLRRREKHTLLLSPEMLAGDCRQTLIRHLKAGHLEIARFVVDEVHCLSDWGHDFRPHYWWVAHHLRALEAAALGQRRGHTAIQRVLLTATADRQVLADVRRHFPELAGTQTIHAPMDRPEIVMSAVKIDSKARRLRVLDRFLSRQKKRPLPVGTARRGIIYCLEANSHEVDDGAVSARGHDRLNAGDICDHLKRLGYKAAYPYSTRNLSKAEREHARYEFKTATQQKGVLTIVVATSAFGMGIDYRAVPFVAHLYPRPTLLEFAQQVGRAGRGMPDGAWAEALSLWRPSDWRYATRFASTPAQDGLLNSFTIPVHGWMYVWKQSGFTMSLRGRRGGRTKFAKLIAKLQELKVLIGEPEPVKVPRAAVRFEVNRRRLAANHVWEALYQFEQDGHVPKKAKKVIRYLRVAAASLPGRTVTLSRHLYEDDRASTVLQRLNRWVDAGYLEFEDRLHSGDRITLRVVGGGDELTSKMIRDALRRAEKWREHKDQSLDQVKRVLASRSPIQRRSRLLEAFEDVDSPGKWPIPDGVPSWLRH